MSTAYSELEETEEQELEGQLHKLFMYDGLTGIGRADYIASYGSDTCAAFFLKPREDRVVAGHLTKEEIENGAVEDGLEQIVDSEVEKLEGYVVDGFLDHEDLNRSLEEAFEDVNYRIDAERIEVRDRTEADVVVDVEEWEVRRLDPSEESIRKESRMNS